MLLRSLLHVAPRPSFSKHITSSSNAFQVLSTAPDRSRLEELRRKLNEDSSMVTEVEVLQVRLDDKGGGGGMGVGERGWGREKDGRS